MNLSCLQDVIELSLNQKLCVVVCLLYTAGYTDVKRSNQGLSDCVYYFRFWDACLLFFLRRLTLFHPVSSSVRSGGAVNVQYEVRNGLFLH